MPLIKNILEKREEKPFVKRKYRPWNYNGTITITNTSSLQNLAAYNSESDPGPQSIKIPNPQTVQVQDIHSVPQNITLENKKEPEKSSPITQDMEEEQMGSKQGAVREQTGIIQETIRKPIENKRESYGKQLGSYLGSESGNTTTNIELVSDRISKTLWNTKDHLLFSY